jgi:enoyl reductase-like protein
MPFSRLLGKPPIMVAGMTPSTVKAGFGSAVLDAGYHIELASGGHNAAALENPDATLTIRKSKEKKRTAQETTP